MGRGYPPTLPHELARGLDDPEGDPLCRVTWIVQKFGVPKLTLIQAMNTGKLKYTEIHGFNMYRCVRFSDAKEWAENYLARRAARQPVPKRLTRIRRRPRGL